MPQIDYAEIEAALLEFYETTADNVCGIGFGYKTTAGELQPVPSVIFHVHEKKKLKDIPADELLPPTIMINGQEYVTDVVETPHESIVPLGTCYSPADQSDPEIARLQSFPNALMPMRGGQEIVMCPDGANKYGNFAVGTLGFFAIDDTDNRVVGVTNAHVVVDSLLYAGDVSRPPATELLDIKNTIEPRYWALDGKKYPACALVRDGGVAFHPAALHVKRYVPQYSVAQTDANSALKNTVDAALLIMNDGKFGATDNYFVDAASFAVRRPIEDEIVAPLAPYLPFATTAELNAIAANVTSPVVYVYSTGRTTGPKGYCNQKRLIISGFIAQLDSTIGGAKFSQIFKIQPATGAAAGTMAGAGGDSGSAILAYVTDEVTLQPTLKIVGLLFAGPNNNSGAYALCCRIDNVASTLGIRAWDPEYNFNRSSSLSVPTPRVISRPRAEAGLSLTVEGGEVIDDMGFVHTYWHAGCTIQGYPPLFEAGSTVLNLSANRIYENNIVGQIVGYLTVLNANSDAVVLDAYSYALVSGGGSDDNESFTIFGNQLRAGIVFDFETKPTYTVRIRATNSAGVITEQAFVITVVNIADMQPTDITLIPNTIAIGTAPAPISGRYVGGLAAISADPDDVFSYFLVSGTGATHNNQFSIVNSSLYLLEAGAVAGVKSIRVRAQNNYNLAYEKVLQVTVTNL